MAICGVQLDHGRHLRWLRLSGSSLRCLLAVGSGFIDQLVCGGRLCGEVLGLRPLRDCGIQHQGIAADAAAAHPTAIALQACRFDEVRLGAGQTADQHHESGAAGEFPPP